LHAMFRERFASDTTAHWLARLDEQDLLCAPVLTLAEALEHEQTRANASIVGLHPDNGGPKAVGSPLTMAEGAFRVRRPPPRLGADSEDVLREAGLSGERIAALMAQGIVA
jgi:crotonobetainyl-CoA:carnitine CoA-transferase CaiB-like acyl-CoA transferase